jgi:hypothetical protein
LYSSRTEDGVNKVLSSVEEQSKNINLHALLNESRNSDNLFRGYTVLNTENNVREVQVNYDFFPPLGLYSKIGLYRISVYSDFTVLKSSM